MDTQQFKFYPTNYTSELENISYSSELENISTKDADSIRDLMLEFIESRGLDATKRYVAVGNCGDCVIYENGVISQVADSG